MWIKQKGMWDVKTFPLLFLHLDFFFFLFNQRNTWWNSFVPNFVSFLLLSTTGGTWETQSMGCISRRKSAVCDWAGATWGFWDRAQQMLSFLPLLSTVLLLPQANCPLQNTGSQQVLMASSSITIISVPLNICPISWATEMPFRHQTMYHVNCVIPDFFRT